MALWRGTLVARRQPLAVLLLGVLPATLTTWAFVGMHDAKFAANFHDTFWPAGQRVLHGLTPYVQPGSPVVAQAKAFVYPALSAVLFAPFAWIPLGSADVTFALLNLGAALLTLCVLNMRDWRVYGVTAMSAAVVSGWLLANITLLMGLGVALVWRYRERPLAAGVLTAVVISLKLFLWPLAVWLLATRRTAALAWAVLSGAVLNVIAWNILGWGELHRYAALLHSLTVIEERRGYSVITLAIRAGASRTAAYGVGLALAGCAVAGCVVLARRGEEVAALALALAASLLASPIVQLHYFALLIVPLALVRPRLSPVWVLPVAMWVCASASADWKIAAVLAAVAAIVADIVRADSGHDDREHLYRGRAGGVPAAEAGTLVARRDTTGAVSSVCSPAQVHGA